jgi:hypothetical protein
MVNVNLSRIVSKYIHLPRLKSAAAHFNNLVDFIPFPSAKTILVLKTNPSFGQAERGGMLPDLDSNQDKQSQSLSYYRYTIRQFKIKTVFLLFSAAKIT